MVVMDVAMKGGLGKVFASVGRTEMLETFLDQLLGEKYILVMEHI